MKKPSLTLVTVNNTRAPPHDTLGGPRKIDLGKIIRLLEQNMRKRPRIGDTQDRILLDKSVDHSLCSRRPLSTHTTEAIKFRDAPVLGQNTVQEVKPIGSIGELRQIT